MGRRVKDEGESECRPVIDRIGVEPPGNITPPERGQTSLGSSVTREPRPTDSGSKQICQGGNACWCGSRPCARLAFHRLEDGLAHGPSAPGAIVKAVREGRWNKVKALVYLLTHSYSGRALAILRVVSNSGAKTPGVDGVLWNTPEAKSAAFSTLRRHGYRPQPLRRVYIPKSNGQRRGLRDSHHGRSSHAGSVSARPRSHRGDPGRRPFLWLSAGTPLCRCPGRNVTNPERSARSELDFGRGYQSLL